MKKRKLNVIGDALATGAGAVLFVTVFESLGLVAVLAALIAALAVFKISRHCDETKGDETAGPDDYPVKIFINTVLWTAGTAAFVFGVLFVFCLTIAPLAVLL
ncbi:MAG: hypothetical protein WC878_04935 [Candidatus Paceibacterota bacterium]|jgi:hypothetical protein